MADTPTTVTLTGPSGPISFLGISDGIGNSGLQSVPRVNNAPVGPANPMPTADANGAAFQGVVAITPGTPVSAARSLGYICTAAGNITLTLANASTITLGIVAGPTLQTLPFAVTNVALGSGTAGTFWNLI